MKYWIVDGDEDNRYEDVDELCDFLFDTDHYDDDDAVRDWINEQYESQECTIDGETFYPADIVEALDRYKYQQLASDWAEERSEEDKERFHDDIDNMENGDWEYYNDYKVECFDEEEVAPPEPETIQQFNDLIKAECTISTVSNNPTSIQFIKQ